MYAVIFDKRNTEKSIKLHGIRALICLSLENSVLSSIQPSTLAHPPFSSQPQPLFQILDLCLSLCYSPASAIVRRGLVL